MTTSNEHNNAPAVLEQELSALLTTSLPYMTPVGRARLGQDIAQLYSSVSAPAVQVYQLAKLGGPTETAWIDVTQEVYEDAGFYKDDFKRRILSATPATAPAQEVGLTDQERADMACSVAAICTGTSSRTVAATAIEWTERALRAKGGK